MADDGWFCWLKCCCVDEVRIVENVVAQSSFGGEAIEWVWFGAWGAVLRDGCYYLGE